jgi:SH3 domain protein
MKKLYQLLCFVLLAGMATMSSAKTEYVTDRIEIGVHQQPDINSAITTQLPSGSGVEVLQEHNGFKRVQLENGSQGWINAEYLVERKPTALEYDQLAEKNKQLTSQLEQTNQKLAKVERTLQVRRDELSNARSTIDDLKNKLKSEGKIVQSDPELEKALAEKNQQIERLHTELENLKEQSEEFESTSPGAEQYKAQLELQKELNQQLHKRIELAQNLLSRDQLPSAEELDKWQVTLPGWYWGTMLIALIIGIGGGIGWMDYRLRRRHGGFRI